MNRWWAGRRKPSRSDAAAERLLRLEAITETALSHLELDQLLDELLDRIRDLLGADTAVMLLLDGEGEFLEPRAAKGLEEELDAGIRIPVGRGFAGRVAAQRAPVVIEDIDKSEVVNPLLREHGIRSLIGVPLLHLGELIGVVHAGSYKLSHFSPEDSLALQLAADRVGAAITQARLFEAEREARVAAETAHEQVSFLAQASELLASSNDYRSTLVKLANLAVPVLADELLVDLAENGRLTRLIAVHSRLDRADVISELAQRYPPDPDAPYGAGAVIRSGEAQLEPEVTEEMIDELARDQEHARLMRRLGLRSFMTVPLKTPGRVHGAITFIASASERRYGPENLTFAQELASRAAAAIETAQLRAETEQRARAALVLDHIGEGVFLLDQAGIVRLWNPAAEATLGIQADAIVGRRAVDAIPGWAAVSERVPVGESADPSVVRPETLPLEFDGGREVWLLISGVTSPGGTVFAFRDMTEERALRDLQTEFVATISHELRTPLAAVYGAAVTLQQRGPTLDEDIRAQLLSVVYDESSRLSRIINDVLWASRLESGRLEFAIEQCSPEPIAASVIRAASAHLPRGVELDLEVSGELPRIATDPDKVRQVLTNVLDNAVKYSLDGGKVTLSLRTNGPFVRFAVRDQGIGIPPAEHSRIFEKFYRLDPNQTRGVGGTGLGLYISRELVRRMDGRLWVESEEGAGATFYVELPLAEADVLAHID